MRMSPPAKLERLPCNARPTVTPMEPSSATKLAVGTPKKSAIK